MVYALEPLKACLGGIATLTTKPPILTALEADTTMTICCPQWCEKTKGEVL